MIQRSCGSVSKYRAHETNERTYEGSKRAHSGFEFNDCELPESLPEIAESSILSTPQLLFS